MSVVGCLFLVLVIGLGIAGMVAAIVRSPTASRPRDDGDDDGGGGGGSRPRVPPDAPPEPSGITPDWWPRFEREFADYVRERKRTVTAD